MIKFILGFIALIAIVWFVFSVAIPLILINTAIITLIAAFVKPQWNKLLLWVAIFAGIFVVLDYNSRWLSGALIENVSMSLTALQVFMYINLTAALIAAYFLIRNYLDEKYPQDFEEGEFSKRNMLVVAGLILVGGLVVFGHNYAEKRTNEGYYPAVQISSNKKEERAINLNPSQPIDNLFNAWQSLDFELYKSQWSYYAKQYSTKFEARNYEEIMDLRKSLFNRLESVEVTEYRIIEVRKINDFKASVQAVYSMVFNFKNGRIVKENGVKERYVVEFDQNRNEWLINENFDYIE